MGIDWVGLGVLFVASFVGGFVGCWVRDKMHPKKTVADDEGEMPKRPERAPVLMSSREYSPPPQRIREKPL